MRKARSARSSPTTLRQAADADRVSVFNPQSGKCLDDTGWSTTPGTQARIWSRTGTANQKWTLP